MLAPEVAMDNTTRKQDVITFKVDAALTDALADMPNRSEFIRNALRAALDSACPLCQGTGIMSPEQKKHWDRFARRHRIQKCEECHAVHLVCNDSDTGIAKDIEKGEIHQ